MSSLKQFKLAEQAARAQMQMLMELDVLVKSIERCEKTIAELKAELEAVNQSHKDRRTTQEDIAYLTELLKCANKKLNWEKQIASLQKRTPSLLQKISTLMDDPKHPPADEMRAAMIRSLQPVRLAMERLEKVKVE